MVLEPGLDLHEWETRWQELQELAVDEPEQTLPEIVRLIEQMLVERGYDLRNPVIVESEDPDIVRHYQAAKEVGDVAEAGNADPGDIAAALENLTEIHDYLVDDRRTP